MVEQFQASQTCTYLAKKGISSHESLCEGKSFPRSFPIGPVGRDQDAWPHSSPKKSESQILAFSASMEGGLLQQWERVPLGCTAGTVWPVEAAASRLVWEHRNTVGYM